MPDLLVGKCDIGMGEISVTLERQKKAFFSTTLDVDGKILLVRCEEQALYQQKLKPGLCAVNPTQYMQYGEKAYLLPRDDMTWKLYVDQWLHLAKVTDNYQKVLGRWIAVPK